MSVSCDKLIWRTSSRRDGWYHGSLRWASLNSGTGNLYTHVYSVKRVVKMQFTLYLRERERDEVTIFRWTLSSGLFRRSLFIAWLNTACLCCKESRTNCSGNMCVDSRNKD